MPNIKIDKIPFSKRALRHYYNIGLLTKPTKQDNAQIDILLKDIEKIQVFREAGLNLNEIGLLMGKELKDTVDFKVVDTPSLSDIIEKLQAKFLSIKKAIQIINNDIKNN